MQLRDKIRAKLEARLAAHLPDVLQTSWDTSAILVMVESLAFKPASGFKGDWERRASFTGVIRAEIRTDNGENPRPEMLAISLLTEPLFVALPGSDEVAPDIGEPCPKLRLVFRDIRDAIREKQVVAALRFDVTGEICIYAPDPGRGTGVLPGGVEPNLIERAAP